LSEPRTIAPNDRNKHPGDNHLKNAVRRVVPRATRNWLRSPSKSLEWLWDAARFFLRNTGSLEISPNSYLACHPRAFKIFRRDQINDPEQSVEFRNFISYCSSAMLLYDVGAHFGIFSLVAAYFGGKAIAVDPSPEAVGMIEIQRALNKSTDRVQTLRAAVSDVDGVIAMLSSGVFSDGYFKVDGQRPESELTQVQAVTIDQMTLKFGIPTHIKIDVEGHEAAVLRGARATLLQYSPILFVELHNEMVISAGENPCAVLDELTALGYHTFALDGNYIDTKSILAKPIIRIVAKHGAL
jgi:FkbM family methyltransferase